MAMTALLNQRIWRFSVGSTVWIRGWAEPAKVTALAAWRARSVRLRGTWDFSIRPAVATRFKPG